MPYREVIEQRLRFLEVGPATADYMRKLKRSLETEIDDILDRFYAHLLQEPKLQRLFPDEETVARARAAQKRYWLDYLFASTFGKEHFEQAEKTAGAHLRGGLELSWYMGGYCYVLNQLVALARSCDGSDPDTLCREIQELNKLVFLDMATVTDMYLEAKNETMRELLRRATVFAEDMTALSEELADAQRDLETKLDSAAAGPELRESAARLSARVENLAARLEDFRFGDRLHTTHHRNA
jgi:hypothetical protein